ncbi:hypothetical protein BV25DRAFT_1622442 [Artomyces pyxidatus]|uniref:Uncharacterized protein n=1 Tax=Artomyces pyxidatus TaxID=48021 RepID=A0ACB8TCT3_9AGAM|nr:hypothetical protein BV25DRAFT_1622442 [Artomyces pyxidatus]
MMSKLTARLMSPQQSRRNDELEKKYLVALTDALGDKVDQYFSIDGLYTDPEYQGRGYGSALVNAVLDLVSWAPLCLSRSCSDVDFRQADKAGRPTYVSAIEKNVPFYESFGFIVAQEVTIGDDPDSHSEPVVLTMIRRYQSTESESWSDEKAALLV